MQAGMAAGTLAFIGVPAVSAAVSGICAGFHPGTVILILCTVLICTEYQAQRK